jgi:hypothetical protein
MQYNSFSGFHGIILAINPRGIFTHVWARSLNHGFNDKLALTWTERSMGQV